MEDVYPQEENTRQNMKVDNEYAQFCHVLVGSENRIKFNVCKVQRCRFFNSVSRDRLS